MCNAKCGTFCLITSIFGIIFLSALAALIDKNYKYVGEWYDENESEDGLPTGEMRSNASKTLYVTAGVYGGFVILSLLCIGIDAKRS